MNERMTPTSRHLERRLIVVALVLGLVGGGDFLAFEICCGASSPCEATSGKVA